MATQSEDLLIMAARHVAEGRNIVIRQRAMIWRLKAAGCPNFDAEKRLALFERTLEIFIDLERAIRAARGGGDCPNLPHLTAPIRHFFNFLRSHLKPSSRFNMSKAV